MKKIYSVNVINENNDVLFTNKCKSKKEVKNIIKSFGSRYVYTVTKNDKLVKSLTHKKAFKIISNSVFQF